LTQGEIRSNEDAETTRRFLTMDEELILPVAERGSLVSAHVPVVYGCSHACTFCIIPYKRGIERSRPVGDIVSEVRSLAAQGVKEVTLLGQIVDRYGKDIADGSNLAGLLRLVSKVDGIERVRFLTSHPNYFGDELIEAIASLPKVMPHIELPIQAGDDTVLENMKRGYTQQDYREIVTKIRARIPDCSIATDIIVGFPGETEAQFIQTWQVLADLKLDVAHLARYSMREGTVATRRMTDDVSDEEKMRRFRELENLQEKIGAEINARYQGQTVPVLFEEKVKGRWRGRTPTNKLVFAEVDEDLKGCIVPVQIIWTGPWSMQANLLHQIMPLTL
jgi:tRNA-2-methylthio-N6-dimethylallyladenosine synthase